ncbi:ATP-binding protein [Gordonia sp. 'Campus']|uniref:ATP-binding protein n=1 Tax=Gordonia sp. 'Campus' TaxID=2915824 RepID=UPI001EE4278A|nr:ATP-binding protein [Gordonia sp. 'Campus']
MPSTLVAASDESRAPVALFRRAFESGSTEPDLDRVRRIGARFLGLGFVGYPVVSVPSILSSAAVTSAWWTPISVLLSVGPGILLFVASFRSGTRWLTPLALATWTGYVLGVALWFVAWNGAALANPDDTAQWMVAFCGMPSMVVMLVHARLAAVGLVAASVLAHISQQLGRFDAVSADLLIEILWSLVFTGVFLAVVLVAIRTGRELDETREETYRTAASVAAASAREVEMARFDAIVHDRVIASLLAVEPGRPDPRLAAQATSALDELARVPGQGPAEVVSRTDAIRRIRSAAAEMSERADVEIVSDDAQDAAEDQGVGDQGVGDQGVGDRDVGDRHVAADDPTVGDTGGGDYPAEVLDAVVEAMTESLRNVVRHAGAGADCAVIIRLASDALSMAVVDNGVGFDPGTVAAGRLGIEVSILGRLARVPGGHAEVRSRAGRGTTVQIMWERP